MDRFKKTAPELALESAMIIFSVLLALAAGRGWPVGADVGLIWLAHVGVDRALGYGLKYGTGFGDTHLGRIGRQA